MTDMIHNEYHTQFVMHMTYDSWNACTASPMINYVYDSLYMVYDAYDTICTIFIIYLIHDEYDILVFQDPQFQKC